MSTYCEPRFESSKIKDTKQVLEKRLVNGESQISEHLLSEVQRQQGVLKVVTSDEPWGSAGLRHTHPGSHS